MKKNIYKEIKKTTKRFLLFVEINGKNEMFSTMRKWSQVRKKIKKITLFLPFYGDKSIF